MDYAVVIVVALVAGGLTLFTGFGLGTLLLPAFLLFFPPPIAVAATAVAHLLNALFKVALVGKWADRSVVLRFGLPAVVAAVAGGLVLEIVGTLPTIASYEIGGRAAHITPVALLVGLLIAVFGVLELRDLEHVGYARRWLPLGGALSGFFGGLSGHQGALRSAFLIRAGLEKEAFIGTGAAIACMVDLSRLAAYAAGSALLARASGAGFAGLDGLGRAWGLVAAASLAGFAGAFVGARFVKKVRLRQVRAIVGLAMIALGLATASGLLGAAPTSTQPPPATQETAEQTP